jgi:hypothetical protein
MIISLGFIRSSSQIFIKELNWLQNSMTSKIVDLTDLPDQNLQGLFIQEDEHYGPYVNLLEKEKSHYPILNAKNDQLDLNTFENLGENGFKDLYFKILNRWSLHQNFNSIENLWILTHHFRELWKKDRISFFEEFWYWIKRNLGTAELLIIFNDVISSEEKDENNEKKERPKLIQSIISGTKKANFSPGTNKEKELMHNYAENFHEVFEVTEFNSVKGQFVATAQIERSPVLLMARTVQLNQLQRTLLMSVFNGLKF